VLSLLTSSLDIEVPEVSHTASDDDDDDDDDYDYDDDDLSSSLCGAGCSAS
jgi:hypothetical protein